MHKIKNPAAVEMGKLSQRKHRKVLTREESLKMIAAREAKRKALKENPLEGFY